MEVLFLEAEAVIGRRDGVFGVIAQDEKARARVPLDAAVRPEAPIVLCKSIQTELPKR
jgi:hypothetical protein